MPHVTIKHFPATLSAEQAATLSAALTTAVTGAFGCPDTVVSIALQPVPAEAWDEQVYQPEIAGQEALLKRPAY
ncbi:4-oxalocrotonate tautomerase [Lentzea fradiae]|uniref:4-oxalocrotonate tautomerase n=1 Tax=Lentzea fradiae TaxID=200378 RepID=A0A1G7UNT0_9PSEU|nr:tautomerase family protein [Lentzea fradiae]SDG49166.1 4-oxalocrotonate tautomerase [Lentzea fradiae]